MAEHDPLVQAAFIASVRELVRGVQIGEFIARLERGDVDGALRALHIDRAAFRALDSAILAAYSAGGAATIGTLPVLRDPQGGRVVVRFDTRNPRAEREIAEHGARLVTAITVDTEQGLRDVIEAGLREGRNPRRTALDIAGRVNRASGRREGGLVGLTAQQMEYVSAARAELSSGDPALMRNYLDRKRRDRRFDRTINKAIREERALAAADVDRIAGRYSDRLLQLRGETIARTETLSALNRAQTEAWMQVGDAGGVRVEQLEKTWLSARDERVREAHRYMNGETVPFLERFSNGMQYPGDEAGGPHNVINCRCVMTTAVAQ